MKNIYFVQANNVYGTGQKTTYIPYSVGCIQAYCLQSEIIKREYNFGKIIYSRLSKEEVIERLDEPYMVLFSCSVWNTEYNKVIAQEIKKVYPECKITFGGHSISSDGETLEKYAYVDFLTHRFGEEPTSDLLECLATGGDLSQVANISYRDSGEIVTTKNVPQTGVDYPSPYLTGVFDEIMNDDIKFSILFETNRGCPNSCSFCDWGSLNSKVRLFPMERVKAEIDWFVEHKIEFVFCTDGNFCLFTRDLEIADYIISCKEKYGYPQVFRVCFTKNKMDLVFKIGEKFCRTGLDKAQTISFQSMSDEVLKNIGRKNIPTSMFKELIKKYNEANLATFSELILGLPGETYDSFCDGVSVLIDNGQHFALNVYPCELLPNAEMSQKSYIEKFKISSTTVPFELIHTNKHQSCNDITEYSVYATSSYSMDKEDWINAMIFAQYVMALHNLGLLRDTAIHYHYEHEMSYANFYKKLINYSADSSGTLLNRVYTKVNRLVKGVLQGDNGMVTVCEGLDDLLWGFDEFIFFEFYKELDLFYKEVKNCFSDIDNNEIIESLFDYQQSIIKKVGITETIIESDYDFYFYFKKIFANEYQPLNKKKTVLKITDENSVNDFMEFAKKVVWFGRNKKATDYTSIYYKISVC
ncbi:MAG: B12-binding domain-containing radical SAM protein [Acutalibacteraceae bacterium]